MGRPRMRPLFKRELGVPAPRLMAAVRGKLSEPGCGFEGIVLQRHVHVTVAASARHLWSPHLSVDVLAEEAPARSVLRGRFGPHPSLWTGIVAVYALLGMLALAGLVFGYSQWTLGWTPWALWAVPVSAFLAATVFAMGAVGQRLSEAQMHELNDFFEACLRGASDPPPGDASGDATA